jgi:dimeric dUTPase (all-alpha-NTP-PPase superfamily)
MMSDIFEKIMERQLELQRLSFGIDPTELQSDERKQYVTAMAMALNVEVAEALQEIPWKPWATTDRFNREAYLLELIDALHFWMNLVLVATDNPMDIIEVYMRKAQINADRQHEGYTGEGKCPTCHR